MIDLIRMNSNGITSDQVTALARHNNLQRVDRNGVITFDNIATKFADGFYLRVEVGRVKLECNLHKYYNHIVTGRQTNYGSFTANNAKATAHLLEKATGLNMQAVNVNYYEIGLNLNMNNDCRDYLDLMETIGEGDNRRPFFVNPRYKDQRDITTVFHPSIKKVYKAYDKVHEMKDKRRTDLPDHPNILRVETTYRRQERLTLSKLLSQPNLNKLINQFVNDWQAVQFTPEIEAPKGTHQHKVTLCRQLLLNGDAETLELCRMQRKEGSLTEKRYRNIREFVKNDWPEFKKQIRVIQTEPEKEYLQRIKEAAKVAMC